MLNSDDVPVDGSTSRSGRKDDGNMEVMMVDGLNHNIDYDAAGDDKNIPPLSSLFAGYKFWWKFAVWPTIFYVMNGVIFGTLIVFDEFEYNSRRDSSFSKENVASYGYKVPDTNTYLAMLRFNALVFAIVLFIDAILLYVAARQVEKEVKVIDDDDLASEDTMPPTDRTSPAAPTSELNYGRHETVYGQVSCKLDAILGRRRAVGPFRSSQRPRDSILVGLLLLACALCAAFGVASVAEWCFTWTAKADKICKSRFGYRSSSGNKKELKPIAGIPDDLQDWARQRYRYSTPSIGFLQLKDKTTIMSSPDPRNSVNKSSSTDVYDQSWDPAILPFD
jgi:hypothetical protein